MQLTLTGHHIDITPALRNFTSDKFDRLNRHFDCLNRVDVIFGVEKLNQIAEANLHAFGAQIHAKSSADDLYSAIDTLIDKLDKQLIKHKEKETDRRKSS